MFNNIPPITKNLLIINILVHIAGFLLFNTQNIDLNFFLGAHFPLDGPHFQPYQIVTHMFAHSSGSLMHILFNMYGLYAFGSVVERNLTPKKYLMLYFAAGLGSFLLEMGALYYQNHADPVLLIGASGAIYGLLVAFAVLYPDSKLTIIFLPFISLKAKHFIPILIGIDLYLGVSRPSWAPPIAHFAHIGGAVIGFLLMYNWKKNFYRWN